MNAPQRIAERIDTRLGAKGKQWKYELVAMVQSRDRIHTNISQIGEYVGTTMFLLLAFGGTHIANLQGATITSTNGEKFINTSNLLFISLSFGMSLIINVWVFFRVSGALFNPAI